MTRQEWLESQIKRTNRSILYAMDKPNVDDTECNSLLEKLSILNQLAEFDKLFDKVVFCWECAYRNDGKCAEFGGKICSTDFCTRGVRGKYGE